MVKNMANKVSILNQTYPTDCPVLLQVRANHADWNWNYHKGYIRYLNGVQNQVYEHQLVVALGYGLKSTKNIHAHHGNENRTDNRLSNLELLANADHARVHIEGTGYKTACDNCGEITKRSPAKFKVQKYNFCSRRCYLFFVRNVHPIGAGSRI